VRLAVVPESPRGVEAARDRPRRPAWLARLLKASVVELDVVVPAGLTQVTVSPWFTETAAGVNSLDEVAVTVWSAASAVAPASAEQVNPAIAIRRRALIAQRTRTVMRMLRGWSVQITR
jgi:hypothetical protein